jgi:hypothetical protein
MNKKPINQSFTKPQKENITKSLHRIAALPVSFALGIKTGFHLPIEILFSFAQHNLLHKERGKPPLNNIAYDALH